MPKYQLTYTVTMPGSQLPPEKFRVKVEAENQIEATAKVQKFVALKVKTTILACDSAEPATAEEALDILKDMGDMLDMMGRMGQIRKKYGLDEKGNPTN